MAVVSILVGMSAGAGASPVPAQTPTVQVAPDAAWSWFSEPRAVRAGGSTFLGWISSTGDVTVGSYSSSGGQTQSFVLMTGFQVDDHNNPAVLLRPDGRLQAFWSGHNGGDVFSRTSQRPRDITSWGPLTTVPVKLPGHRVSTYANPVLLPAENDRLYVFARSGYLDPAFTTSPDLGRTWTRPRQLLSVQGQRPYVKYADDGRATIGMAFTNGHPRDAHTSIHYAAYRAGSLRRADGRVIAPLARLPISPGQADLVFAAAKDRDAWVHDVAFDRLGRPRIVFATVPQRGTGPHDYWYAAWTGKTWSTSRLTGAGGSISEDPRELAYTAGIALDHTDPSTLVLSRPGTLKLEVERWTTPDSGRTWAVTPVTTASTQDNVRPVVPRGPSGQVVWMTGRYGYFTSFRTAAATDSTVVPATPLPSSLSGATAVRGAALDIQAALRVGLVLGSSSKELTLQSRPVGWKTWRHTALATTDTAGRAVFSVPHKAGTEYRIVWPGDHTASRSETPVLRG